jgi:hypothetical protein
VFVLPRATSRIINRCKQICLEGEFCVEAQQGADSSFSVNFQISTSLIQDSIINHFQIRKLKQLCQAILYHFTKFHSLSLSVECEICLNASLGATFQLFMQKQALSRQIIP